MKKTVLLLMGVILMSALAFAEVTAAGNKLCPVSADPVDKNISAEYNEKSYGLCCKMCINKFKKNPEKYLQEMNGAAAAKDDHSAHQH